MIWLPSNTVWVSDELAVAIIPSGPGSPIDDWATHDDGEARPIALVCKACRGMGAAKSKNCVDCNASGRVPTPATIQVVPVVGALHGEPGFGEQGPRVVMSPSGVFLIAPGEQTAILPLDPLPTPGRDYAVIVRTT